MFQKFLYNTKSIFCTLDIVFDFDISKIHISFNIIIHVFYSE
jgi:hypothetical protein